MLNFEPFLSISFLKEDHSSNETERKIQSEPAETISMGCFRRLEEKPIISKGSTTPSEKIFFLFSEKPLIRILP